MRLHRLEACATGTFPYYEVHLIILGGRCNIGRTMCAVLFGGGPGPPYGMVLVDRDAAFVLPRWRDDAAKKIKRPRDISNRKPSVR